MDLFIFVSAVIATAFSLYNVHSQNVANKRAYNQQRELLEDQAPLSMAGYEKAGINPFAADSSLSLSSASTPSVTAPQLDTNQIGNLLNSFTQSQVGESTIKVNAEQVDLIRSSVGVNEAQARYLAKSCEKLNTDMEQARATIKLLRQQRITEGYKQENIAASTNLIGQQAETESVKREELLESIEKMRAEKAEILSRRDLNQYNLQHVLPLTVKELEKVCAKYDIDLDRAKIEVAKAANELILSSADVERVLVKLQPELRKLASKEKIAALKSEYELQREEKRASRRSSEYVNPNNEYVFDIFDILGITVDEITSIADIAKLLGVKGLLPKE